jgi:hypothetical protein
LSWISATARKDAGKMPALRMRVKMKAGVKAGAEGISSGLQEMPEG